MAEFFYQTLQVENRLPQSGGPSTGGQAVAAGVKLLHKASKAMNEWAVSWRVNREIEARAAEINRVMPPNGGVLLCVGTQEWEQPDFTGSRAQSFLSLHVVGGGSDPVALLNRYLSQPQLVQGAPKGWRRRDAYVWVTRASR
jgi:hypothetical protein